MLLRYLGHSSFEIHTSSKRILIDPLLKENPTAARPSEKADIVFITHEHFDHCAPDDIRKNISSGAIIVASEECTSKLSGFKAKFVRPGQKGSLADVSFEAVPAYNVNKFKEPGVAYHPKSSKVGFIIEADGKRVYHAGDTDFIPEMKELQRIDVALLPIGGTFTMTIDEAVEAAKTIHAKLTLPMHYKTFHNIQADPEEFVAKLKAAGLDARALQFGESIEV
jgi:L-ascorbate metabolism protein UlaG (beta-lactamase superfamily)